MNPEAIYYLIIYAMVASSVLIYCLFATMTITSIAKNSERVYFSLWYKLPTKHQFDLKFLILFTQQEREIRGFNFIQCSTDTFLRVR